MSRYVNLDGVTWDGTPIASKIQEVKTRVGYMQGITVGWLWGDAVPHLDLEEHDKQIRADVYDELISKCNKYSYTAHSSEFAKLLQEWKEEKDD